MENEKPIVAVAMSSYNGEKYISAQIESILSQADVDVRLVVRDDGSSDSTVSILKKYEESGKLSIILGENVGYGKSFMLALFACENADFYAFADQDDIWLPEKLIRTIKVIKDDKKPAFAFCNAYFTDENLNIINNGYDDNYRLPEKEMTFSITVASGYLMVMNKKLVELLRIAGENVHNAHDVWVGAVTSYLGNIYYVRERLVYHRRLKNSVSRLSIGKLLKNRTKALIIDRGVNIPCAELMLSTYKDMLSKEDIEYLLTLSNYRKDFKDKLTLIRNKKIVYDVRYGKWTPKLKILLNRF